MKYLILLLALNACTGQPHAHKENIIDTYLDSPDKVCDQAELDAHTAKMGGYEIQCEELGAL